MKSCNLCNQEELHAITGSIKVSHLHFKVIRVTLKVGDETQHNRIRIITIKLMFSITWLIKASAITAGKTTTVVVIL